MSDLKEVLIINCSRDTAETIHQEIASYQDSQLHLTQRKNLDGSIAAWILMATLMANTVPPILAFIGKHLEVGQVKKIRIGDIEIENPTREDVDRLLNIIDRNHGADSVDKSAPLTASAVPTRSHLRRLLELLFKSDVEFNAFCIDYFPDIFDRFSASMERTDKHNLLLLHSRADDLFASLKKKDPAAVSQLSKHI